MRKGVGGCVKGCERGAKGREGEQEGFDWEITAVCR